MSIKEYLPVRTENEELVGVSARIPKGLLTQVKAIAKRENLSFTDVVEACLIEFTQEMGQPKKSA
jgi:hypothetical protein